MPKKTQMTIIKSVSLTEEHAEMVKRDGISLSGVLRKALDDIHAYKTGDLLDTTASMSKKIERITENLNKAMTFIYSKGLSDDFLAQE